MNQSTFEDNLRLISPVTFFTSAFYTLSSKYFYPWQNVLGTSVKQMPGALNLSKILKTTCGFMVFKAYRVTVFRATVFRAMVFRAMVFRVWFLFLP